MPTPLATGAVAIWWSAPHPYAELSEWLDPTERQRLEHLRQPADRDRFATARAALKSLVGSAAGVDPATVALAYPCPTCDRPHGRPQVVAPAAAVGLAVSIAHAGDRVLVAATGLAGVGVDVEATGEPRPDLVDVARIALAPSERAVLDGLPAAARERAVLEYWVRKEAVLKAAGVGLRGNPASLEVSPPDEPPALMTWNGPGALPAARLAVLDVGAGFTAVLAVAGPDLGPVELSPWRG